MVLPCCVYNFSITVYKSHSCIHIIATYACFNVCMYVIIEVLSIVRKVLLMAGMLLVLAIQVFLNSQVFRFILVQISASVSLLYL